MKCVKSARALRTGWVALTLAAAIGVSALTACAPLVVGAAMGTGVMVATDRRTSGAQLEDETIELRTGSRVRERFADTVRVNVTSFNRRVLLTGEVPSESTRQAMEQIAAGVENVKEVVNELAVLTSPDFFDRQKDVLLTGRVKLALLDAKDLQAQAVKVVSERGTVYLMGKVTERERERATDIVRTTTGVLRVVRLFEIITEDELRQMQSPSAPTSDATAKPVR